MLINSNGKLCIYFVSLLLTATGVSNFDEMSDHPSFPPLKIPINLPVQVIDIKQVDAYKKCDAKFLCESSLAVLGQVSLWWIMHRIKVEPPSSRGQNIVCHHPHSTWRPASAATGWLPLTGCHHCYCPLQDQTLQKWVLFSPLQRQVSSSLHCLHSWYLLVPIC